MCFLRPAITEKEAADFETKDKIKQVSVDPPQRDVRGEKGKKIRAKDFFVSKPSYGFEK